MVGVVPNAAYRHFADRDELLAAVCTAAMKTNWPARMQPHPRVRGQHGDAAAARRGWARSAPRTWTSPARNRAGSPTAFAVPQRHDYGAPDGGTEPDRSPLNQLRARLDELVDAGVLDPRRREGIEYPIWSAVHGLAVLHRPRRATPAGLLDVPATLAYGEGLPAITSKPTRATLAAFLIRHTEVARGRC